MNTLTKTKHKSYFQRVKSIKGSIVMYNIDKCDITKHLALKRITKVEEGKLFFNKSRLCVEETMKL